jgi:hypothetical protein
MLHETQYKHDEALIVERSYEHVYERLRRDILAQQITNRELQESLKSKIMIKDHEFEKEKKADQDRIQSKARFDELMLRIEDE